MKLIVAYVISYNYIFFYNGIVMMYILEIIYKLRYYRF